MNKLNFVITAMLMIGLVAGLVLVQQTQDIRQRAKEKEKVQVCHHTGSDTNPYQPIEVDEHAVKSHLDHGDNLGDCPAEAVETPDDNQVEDRADQEGGSQDGEGDKQGNKSSDDGGGSSGESSSNTNTSSTTTTTSSNTSTDGGSNDSGATSSGSAPTPQPTPTPIPTSLIFKVKFDGIDSKITPQILRVKLGINNNYFYSYRVHGVADDKGVMRAAIEGVKPNKYDVLVVADNYLQRKFEQVEVKTGESEYDWAQDFLIPGDFNGDNKVTGEDLAEILANFKELSVEAIGPKAKYDTNKDGAFDASDISLVLENYTSLVVGGEQ